MANYALTIKDETAKSIARGWLHLGLASLVFAGLFSLLLVLSRTPAIQEIIPWTNFFHTALVVHVDLSVLIWFLSFSSLLWCLNSRDKLSMLGKSGLFLAIAGTALIIITPFTGEADPLLNNYIPILQHPLFFGGLLLFISGVILTLIRTFLSPVDHPNRNSGESAIRLAIRLAALTTSFALLAFFYTFATLPSTLEGTSYYEVLFWGNGHILQFSHTVLLLAAWLWLASACNAKIAISPRPVRFFMIVTVAPVLTALLIYANHDLVSTEQRHAFTSLMKYGGLASLPLGLLICHALFTIKSPDEEKKPLFAALLSSLILFAAGGIIGFMIEGINVVIPAHYHGSIVGITLAFMGLCYALLPKLGYSAPHSKMARLQPYIYGGGQLMHILGLAWSGGYGVQRKTAGAAQGLDRLPEVAGMAMMGLGGLISIIGGLLFLIVAYRSMGQKQPHSSG